MTDYIRLDVAELENAIAELMVQYPELAEDDRLRADMFEAETNLHGVIAKLLDRERDAKCMAEAVKARRADLHTRQARYERQEEGWRALILRLMERANVKKIVLAEATLSISHRAPEPVIVDEAKLPDPFWKLVRTLDKALIKQVWKETGELPIGTVLNNGSSSLSVRVR